MNGLEEIQEFIKKFIYEKENVQKQIAEIEEKRTQLAQERNEKKKVNYNDIEVNEIGKQISELGNQSQELQNKLDFTFNGVKTQVKIGLDNFVAEEIRKARLVNEQIQEFEMANEEQKQRKAKFQLQRQEFFARFGRMPELSESAINESKSQEKQAIKNISEIKKLELQLGQIEERASWLAKINKEFKNGNWNCLLEVEPFYVEELNVEGMEPIEELHIEQFDAIEELYVEEFEPIQEVNVETFEPIQNNKTEENKNIINEIEELAKSIVEEIVAEQTKDLNINTIEEIEEEPVPEDIIAYEEKQEKKERVIIPLFGQIATISNITVKIEDAQLVYKAQMSDGEEIKIYPAKLGEESVLLRDKQNREECKEILINYAVSKYREFDKKVINKIDPLVCELLIECAERYSYNPQELIYNYAMSFSNEENDAEPTPDIIYNLSFIQDSNLTRKEKAIINKVCKNARKNNKIDIIETFSGFRKIKYVLKRLFAINNVNVLPESKY